MTPEKKDALVNTVETVDTLETVETTETVETVKTVETVETGQDKFSGHCNYMRLPWSDF